MGRLWRRLRYLWTEMDPDGVELLSAFLSLSFGILLLYQGRRPTTLGFNYFYAALCFTAALSKLAGVVLEWVWLRLLGVGAGTIFWCTLAYVLHRTVPTSIAWLCFAVLALAQLWAAHRITAQWKYRRAAPETPR